MNNIHLLLVLQTHSLSNAQGEYERFCKAPKSEVLRRCTKSLVKSINYALRVVPNFSCELVVLDDHSDVKSIDNLQKNLSLADCPTKLIHLDTYGIMPSILACYKYGKEHGKDWVYFVQDDYLYEENAIADMLFVALSTSDKLQKYTCIFPYDDPYRYIPENTAITSHIIRECGRHWRTQVMTSSCFMVHHSILLKEYDLFDAMGNHPLTNDMEDNTINQLFRTRGYYLFVPLKSLALHIQGPNELDPFINWKILWDQFKESNIEHIDITRKNLLNLGYIGEKLDDDEYAKGLTNYFEITFSEYSEHNPHILGNLDNLTDIPNESFDCIYAKNVLEYLHLQEAHIVLKQFLRILKDNGFAKIIVPNIRKAGMHLVQDKLITVIKDTEDSYKIPYDILFSQKCPTKDVVVYSKSGYTVEIIKSMTKDFKVSIEEKNCDLVITLTKENGKI